MDLIHADVPDLGPLPQAVVRELSSGARTMAYVPGEVVARIGERFDPGVVTAGLLRISIRSHDGRQATVRYIRKGQSFGEESIFQPSAHIVAAVTESEVTHYDRLLIEQLMRKHPAMSINIARRLAAAQVDNHDAVAQFAFMTVAQRVVHHLVAIARPPEPGQTAALARVSHQELADAVGSVREVVARVIKDLKTRNLIATTRSGILITNEMDIIRFGLEPSRVRATDDTG